MRQFFLLSLFGILHIFNFTNVEAQNATPKYYSLNQITPLNIGDKCPDFLFKKIINWPTTSGKLSDHKGKLIILDFWSTYCSTCISDFPKKQFLQNKFNDSLQVLLVADQKNASSIVPVFWPKNVITKNLKLPCVIDSEQILQKYFPRETLGLQVWIDGNGIVRGITTPEYVNEDNIRKLLLGENIKMPVYRFLSDKNIPFLKTNEIGGAQLKLLYYSSLFNYMPNLSRDESGVTIIDSADNTKTIRDYNFGIKVLYDATFAYHPLVNKRKQIVWQIKDSSRYFYTPSLGYEYDWRVKNAYCYEAKVPLNMSDSIFLEYKRQDLDKFFGLRNYEKRILSNCYALRSIRENHSPLKKISSKGAVIDEGQNHLNNELTGTYNTTEELVNGLSLHTNSIIIDDLNLKYDISVVLTLCYDLKSNSPKYVSTIREFNKQLENYGFRLELVERLVDFLYITDY